MTAYMIISSIVLVILSIIFLFKLKIIERKYIFPILTGFSGSGAGFYFFEHENPFAAIGILFVTAILFVILSGDDVEEEYYD